MSELSPDVPRAAFNQQSEWYEETITGLRAKLARVTAERDAIRQATADEIATEIEAEAGAKDDASWDDHYFAGLYAAAEIARRVGSGGGGEQ